MPRGLSDAFMTCLTDGDLRRLMARIRIDHTLSLGIRDDRINLYYRGGSLMRLDGPATSYEAHFDKKYCLEGIPPLPDLPRSVCDEAACSQWVDAIPELKQAMDIWFVKIRKKAEREFQQRIERVNNVGRVAKSTDYFVCDIEYASDLGTGRKGPSSCFDMVAVEWPSTREDQMKSRDLRITLLEVKYGDGALKKKAGLVDHVKKLNAFLGRPKNLAVLKRDMLTVFNQRHKLGLIRSKCPIRSFSNDRPQYILVLANHDPSSTILRKELEKLPECRKAEILVAMASPMGYGLYHPYLIPLADFVSQLK